MTYFHSKKVCYKTIKSSCTQNQSFLRMQLILKPVEDFEFALHVHFILQKISNANMFDTVHAVVVYDI